MSIAEWRVRMVDWEIVERDLDEHGYATTGPILSRRQCASLRKAFADDSLFRKTVVMARHGYGRGEYKYFNYPLPEVVATFRETFYRPLAGVANRWNEQLRREQRFPMTHAEFLKRCHAAGQERPTPLVLRYETGDFNCLHQDVYGEHVFPLQVAILLSDPAQDFTGGEFVLTEQRPRKQSRVEVVPLRQGEGVIFPVQARPAAGTRGIYRANMRHGVSRLRSGERYTLGVIFHDAK
ncbi:MAG TPA: 2OG-Fe(II) oxygenase [Pirellulales bacterium]|nr:2OG-Fe(II) oxygenase [Pirellulales bacterium]